ncbi:MAG: 2-oxoacid:acceptor oxidoreductase subunit alpha [Euryarchaeota archaeon]|nr:2-oxoacid:acceptor oxidoreductase subunit alpha [Euryarchaeota archaeon]
MKGDEAVVEGAIAAGCRFYAGYPITPSSEVAERMSKRMPRVGGTYIQMEDEIGSLAAVLGASCAGAKAMTATSGPGFSLMQENLGLAIMMEAPCVIVDVQRGGPSTGLPTLTSQGDMLQARFGSHGDYEIIAYSPSSVQEMFDLTIKAFNAAEKYRTPVVLLADQVVGQMTSTLMVPEEASIHRTTRATPTVAPSLYKPFDARHLVPPMALAGGGFRVHMTGLTHNERGAPATNAEAQEQLVRRLVRKIRENASEIVEVEERFMEDAEVALVVYGSTLGPALEAVRHARAEGMRVGLLRLVTPWPFPREAIQKVSATLRALVVAEGNLGQMVHPVREYAKCPVIHLGIPGGRMLRPDEILRTLRGVAA